YIRWILTHQETCQPMQEFFAWHPGGVLKRLRVPHSDNGIISLRQCIEEELDIPAPVLSIGIQNQHPFILRMSDAGFERSTITAIAPMLNDFRASLFRIARGSITGTIINNKNFVWNVLQGLTYFANYSGNTIFFVICRNYNRKMNIHTFINTVKIQLLRFLLHSAP